MAKGQGKHLSAGPPGTACCSRRRLVDGLLLPAALHVQVWAADLDDKDYSMMKHINEVVAE